MSQTQNDPITPWIAAYLDGELTGSLRERVQAHLAACPACQAEEAALRSLSAALHTIALPASPVSDAAFASAVVRRLPERGETFAVRALRAGWRYAPVALVAGWAFCQAVLLVAGALLIGLRAVPGAADILTAWLPFLARASAGDSGMLPGWLRLALPWQVSLTPTIAGLSPVGPLALINLLLLVVVAALFAGWLASWWAYHNRSVQTGVGE